jgi:hypothetical protein
VQGVRHVLQEQRQARGSGRQRLDPRPHLLGASPEGDGQLHVGQFLRERLDRIGQHPPVVQEWEPREPAREHPVRGHGMRGEFPPCPASRAADVVLAERRQPEEVRGGVDVGRAQLQVRDRYPLDEDASPADLCDRAASADAGGDGCGRRHQLGEFVVAEESEGGRDVGVGGAALVGGHRPVAQLPA